MCSRVCTCVDTSACMCTQVYMLEVSRRCPQVCFPLCWHIGSHWTHNSPLIWLDGLASKPQNPPVSSTFPGLGLQVHTADPSFVRVCWGSKLRFSSFTATVLPTEPPLSPARVSQDTHRTSSHCSCEHRD